ncbi:MULTISPECIES: homoserine kinase [unclassified Pseudovibrio]|uniref:homoserine kinase n=1 Tax=unclassified Pseudovibrio TaxID=2627060 RepID=UPI0007AEA617|nr:MULTISPECIES: homoserine kinase [unclassified Pseudovibrio]KZK94118.1 Homoserine kinase [Pseudovibrio sp. W74]KZL10026.1 Homoserine kinase [Pseudovibrio sp. Ad14]
MAVYTDVSDEELGAFIDRFNIGNLLSYKGIAEGVENSNYLVHTETGYYILTLYEKRVNPDDLPFFLGLMQHLASNGLNCPTPLIDRDDQMLGELAGRPAAMVTFLDGMWVRKPQLVHCAELGKGMARMHLAGADFEIKRPNSLSVDGWAPLLDASRERAHEVKVGLAEELTAELDELQALWPKELPNGVIHADLFPDNVFYLGKELSGLIDFYFACNDAFAYDVAICINAWCFEPDGMFNVTKARALLEGYRSVRPFSELEFDNLPLLCRGAALRFLLTRLYDWLSVPEGALVVPKDPLEYLHKLRFHRGVSNASAYGLDK